MKSETLPTKKELTYEEQVQIYLTRMLSNRKNRRHLAKRDGQLKNWQSVKEHYLPINKPIDLGINKFKKLARERLEKPYKTVLGYKQEMHMAFDNIRENNNGNSTTRTTSPNSN